MVEVKKILFPVDFFENSSKILPYVEFMAEKLGAKIELIHVVRGPGEYTGFELGVAWYSSLKKDVIGGAEKAMSRFVNEHMSDIEDVKTTVEVGDAVENILDYANKNKIDMIIMGTHGRKGLEQIMFGSVARGVVKGASCPVLTVNPYKVNL
ncbi:MAG: universal stress protein [Nitrospiraceae bacterium]|nr:universal stress protein [Nitrospiraceae bacterium]